MSKSTSGTVTFRVDAIMQLTIDLYGVMGNPIQQSLSPQLHHLFAEQFQDSLIYKPILVPLDGFQDALKHFQLEGGKGLNVTLPFKQLAIEFVDLISERAKIAGAINTIIFHEDGVLAGDNTDGVGLVRDITKNLHFNIFEKNILILGAGGAVRGILAPILEEKPARVVISNRTESKAQLLADEFKQYGFVEAVSLTELATQKFDLVINATSASLHEDDISLPDNILNASAVCYDLMYGKEVTAFLSWAKKNGAANCVDGLGMLIEQGAESFYLWRKKMPDTAAVFSLLKGESYGGSERF